MEGQNLVSILVLDAEPITAEAGTDPAPSKTSSFGRSGPSYPRLLSGLLPLMVHVAHALTCPSPAARYSLQRCYLGRAGDAGKLAPTRGPGYVISSISTRGRSGFQPTVFASYLVLQEAPHAPKDLSSQEKTPRSMVPSAREWWSKSTYEHAS